MRSLLLATTALAVMTSTAFAQTGTPKVPPHTESKPKSAAPAKSGSDTSNQTSTGAPQPQGGADRLQLKPVGQGLSQGIILQTGTGGATPQPGGSKGPHSLGPKPDDPSGMHGAKGSVAIGPKPEDPKGGAKQNGSHAIGPKQDDPSNPHPGLTKTNNKSH